MVDFGVMARATPIAVCASSSSPSASIRGSVFRTRDLPNSEVSPPSPVRVVTRAEARFRAGTAESIRSIQAMLVQVRSASTGLEGQDADWSRRGQGQEGQEEVQRAARERAEEEDGGRAGPADDHRARATQAQGEGLVGHSPE